MRLARSLADAQVDLPPHQAEAALFAFQIDLATRLRIRRLPTNTTRAEIGCRVTSDLVP